MPKQRMSPSEAFVETLVAQGVSHVFGIVDPALRAACEAQRGGRTTVLEVMGTRELGDPFRRDALKPPLRLLPKYAALNAKKS